MRLRSNVVLVDGVEVLFGVCDAAADVAYGAGFGELGQPVLLAWRGVRFAAGRFDFEGEEPAAVAAEEVGEAGDAHGGMGF
jgi:hypothetical protein